MTHESPSPAGGAGVPFRGISQADAYRELILVADLLELLEAAENDEPGRSGGITAGLEIARRMVTDLANKVEP